MSVLENAKCAAVIHEHIDLFIDLVSYAAGQGNEREATDDVLYFSKARFLVDLVSLAGISLNKIHIRIGKTKTGVKFRVEFESNVTIATRQDRFNELGDRSGADTEFENNIILVRFETVDHCLSKLRRAWRDRAYFARIF